MKLSILKFATLSLSWLLFAQTAQAQTSPDCPLWGPVYPKPTEAHKSSTIAKAIDQLQQSLNKGIHQGIIGSTNASFHLQVFSSDHILLNYSYAAPQNQDSLTKGVLDKNTVFRIGSTSKFIAVYTLLAATGFKYINDPVTKWVPELAALPGVEDEDIYKVDWSEITLGALAGHEAGLVKDFSLADLSLAYNRSMAQEFGLPALSSKEIPHCGPDPSLRACTRKEFFSQFNALRPVTAPFNMPIYSNVAFQILAYALEGITKKTFPEVFDEYIRTPLKLNATYLSMPPASANVSAIIPGGEVGSGWKIDVGDGAASAQGFMLSTGADFAAIGQSVLASSLLSPASTRRWLRPVSNTPDLRFAVGMPWEIRRMDVAAISSAKHAKTPTRIMDLYTKNGGIGAYYAQIALSPDHGFGFILMHAGKPPSSGTDQRFEEFNFINEKITDIMVPAFEAAAAEEATRNLAGTYIATDHSGMEMTIVGEDGHLGLGVKNWTMKGLDLLATYPAALSGSPKPPGKDSPKASLRLYPVELHSKARVGFRGVYGAETNESSYFQPGKPFGAGCGAWGGVGDPGYGNVGLDDFVFEVDKNGRAVGVEARGVRKTLKRS